MLPNAFTRFDHLIVDDIRRQFRWIVQLAGRCEPNLALQQMRDSPLIGYKLVEVFMTTQRSPPIALRVPTEEFSFPSHGIDRQSVSARIARAGKSGFAVSSAILSSISPRSCSMSIFNLSR